jgi:hypothetical protein
LGERRYSSYLFLTSALDGGEWSASHPGRDLPPGERTPSTHWIGGWVGPRAGLDAGARTATCQFLLNNIDTSTERSKIGHNHFSIIHIILPSNVIYQHS